MKPKLVDGRIVARWLLMGTGVDDAQLHILAWHARGTICL